MILPADLPLCACGCGDHVLTAGARFRPAHHLRLRRCKPWNRLQERIIEHVTLTGQTLFSFAEELDIKPPTFRSWFQHEGSFTARRNLERIADAVGVSVDDAIAAAGGTAEGQLAEQARTIGATYRDSVGKEALKASGHELGRRGKGRPRSEEHIRKVQAARAASGGKSRSDAARMKANKSINMRIVSALFSRLRRGQPTPENLQRWARDVSHAVARKSSISVPTARGLVAKYWQPYLKERDLHIKPGRPPLDELVTRRRAKAIEDANGNLAIAVTEIQKTGMASKGALRVWRWRERKRHA